MAWPAQVPESTTEDTSAFRTAVQSKRKSVDHVTTKDLFRDPHFPPDWTSLTYVYSGEDKYERTIFKRPSELCSCPVLVGVGGVCDQPFPWQRWRGRYWFQAAAVVVSLCVRILDKVIPGYRDMEQSFQQGYTGAFHLRQWRFGEWQEIILDDFLPTVEGRLLFCQALGSPPEFWAPLAEKAYAKSKKTFQAIEFGRTLDALTDLTGAVCEFYTPDVNPPERLFLILFKSVQCRSLLVAWRNEKRLTETAFDWDDVQKAEGIPARNPNDVNRYLHLITAVTKVTGEMTLPYIARKLFPMTDGRVVEMIRLCCLFDKEPKWQGKYSDRDIKAWNSIKSEFLEKCRPLSSLEKGEFWMTMEDFQCNFGGLIIASSEGSLKPEALDIDRKYEVETGRVPTPAPLENPRTMERQQHRRTSSLNERRGSKGRGHIKRHVSTLGTSRPQVTPMETKGPVPAVAITVQEGRDTVVVDNTQHDSDIKSLRVRSEPVLGKTRGPGIIEPRSRESVQSDLIVRTRLHSDGGPEDSSVLTLLPEKCRTSVDEVFEADRQLHRGSVVSNATVKSVRTKRGDGVVNHSLLTSEGSSSTSEISLHFQTGMSFEDRPRSAPLPGNARSQSRGSVCSLTHRHFRAPRADFFQSRGRWRTLLQHKDKWTKARTASSRNNMDAHSKSPRFLFTVSKPEDSDGVICSWTQGTRHVLVSLMEDYRHGASTANSLVVPIGFCLYKVKNPDKDEKRHISKLQFVGEVNGQPEMREVTSRFDLHPGNFFLVPYSIHCNHEGEFLIRVLAEGEISGDKAGCRIT